MKIKKKLPEEYAPGDVCFVGQGHTRVYFRIDYIDRGVANVICPNLTRGRLWTNQIEGLAPEDVAEAGATWEALL